MSRGRIQLLGTYSIWGEVSGSPDGHVRSFVNEFVTHENLTTLDVIAHAVDYGEVKAVLDRVVQLGDDAELEMKICV